MSRGRGGPVGYGDLESGGSRPNVQPAPQWGSASNPASAQQMGMSGPQGPGLPRLKDLIAPSFNKRSFIFMITVLQILVFICSLFVGQFYPFDRENCPSQHCSGAFADGNSMAGPSSATLILMGAKFVPGIKNWELWRLVLPIMLHGGIMHIAFNMFFQAFFGFRFEKEWGVRRMIAFYFATGVGASLFSSVLSPQTPSVGASGALFGILGAGVAFLGYNWNTVPGAKMRMCNLVCIIVMNFMFSTIGGGGNVLNPEENTIDNWAHLGGLMSGLFLGLAFSHFVDDADKARRKTWRMVGGSLAAIFFVVNVAVLVFVIHCRDIQTKSITAPGAFCS